MDHAIASIDQPRRPRPLLVLAAILVSALALLIPCFLVGHPDMFPDTSAYDLVGQWVAEQAGLHFDHGYGLAPHHRSLAFFFTMAGARSPYYGALLFLTTVRGSAWAMAALQAVCAGALVALTVRVVLRRLRLGAFALVIGFLTIASSLPYFVSFLMPDVFGGLGSLAAILLLVFFDRLRVIERWALGVFLALTLTFHGANPPVIAAVGLIAVAALVLRALPLRPTRAGLAVVVAALAASTAAAALYPLAVRQSAHLELSRPPFIAARLLADGPGRRYLRAVCAHGSPYVLCRFKDRPMTDANDILWAISPAKGVFEPADYATRLALTHEETRFAAGVVAFDPLATLWGLAWDSGQELVDVSIVDTLGYGDRARLIARPRFPPPLPFASFCVRGRTGYCFATPAQEVSEFLLQTVMALCALYLAGRLALSAVAIRAAFHRAPLSPRLTVAAVAVVGLMVANAVVCGAISGVYPRYEMRLAWLLPLFAVLAWLETSGPAVTFEDVVQATSQCEDGSPTGAAAERLSEPA